MPKKKEVEKEEVTCPVCGKPVGLEVLSCPNCGAEFEEEAEAEPEAAAEEEMAECPVCGKVVGLTVPSCPNCGAEFEEEKVEEVIEVEEEVVPKKAAAKPPPAEEEREVAEEVEVEEEARVATAKAPASIVDLRVIGIALVILGIIGSQIAFMIDWYWSWVPPIEDNVGLFVTLPLVVIVAGLLLFLLIRNALAVGKSVPVQMPGASLSMFLFGIFALVLVLLYRPINDALQSSQAGVGAAFVILLVVGILAVMFGMRAAKASESP